jgi:hypothetical protein
MSEIQEQIQRHIDTLVGAGAETGVQVAVYQDGALIVDAVAGPVDGAPAFLGGLDQLECHGDPGGLGAGSLGDLGLVPDRGEGQLDGVGLSINAVA